ncbi:MAG: hypothetical protein WC554_18590 [Clostridia bacterium]
MLNKKYQSASSVIATYDNYDFAEGTGIVNFRGFKYDVSGSTVYGLSNQDNYSYGVETTETITETDTKEIDIDFDLSEFESPKTIKGTAIVSIPMNINQDQVGETTYGYVVARIRKWDGTTETEIASGTSNRETVSENADTSFVKTLKIDVPITSFKVGETLRLTIEAWANSSVGGTGTISIGHDPQNRDGTWIIPSTDQVTTNLNFYCPFRLEEA